MSLIGLSNVQVVRERAEVLFQYSLYGFSNFLRFNIIVKGLEFECIAQLYAFGALSMGNMHAVIVSVHSSTLLIWVL